MSRWHNSSARPWDQLILHYRNQRNGEPWESLEYPMMLDFTPFTLEEIGCGSYALDGDAVGVSLSSIPAGILCTGIGFSLPTKASGSPHLIAPWGERKTLRFV